MHVLLDSDTSAEARGRLRSVLMLNLLEAKKSQIRLGDCLIEAVTGQTYTTIRLHHQYSVCTYRDTNDNLLYFAGYMHVHMYAHSSPSFSCAQIAANGMYWMNNE